MVNEAREKLYQKLMSDSEFAVLVCSDLSNKDLNDIVKPNKLLMLRCAPFIKKGNISNKTAVINEIVKSSKGNYDICRLLMLTWITSNKETLKFIETNVTQSVINELKEGRFGSEEKIRILSKIDDRNGIEKVFSEYFSYKEAEQNSKELQNQTTNLKDNLEELKALKKQLEDAQKRINELEKSVTDLKQNNKNQKEILQQKSNEASTLTSQVSAINNDLKQKTLENERLNNDINGLKFKLSFLNEEEQKNSEKIKSLENQLEIEKNKNNSIQNYANQLKNELNKLEYLKEQLPEQPEKIAELYIKIKKLEQEKLNSEKQKEDLLKNIDLNKDNKINYLNNLVSKLENDLQKQESVYPVFGQIIDKHLFITFFDEAISLNKELTGLNDLLREEFAVLYIDKRTNQPVKIESAETNEKKEIIGVIVENNGKYYLECVEEEINPLPIFSSIDNNITGHPAKGIYLPDITNRPEGIYGIACLKSVSTHKKETLSHSAYKETKKETLPAKEELFDGQKLLIIGGDRVGSEYERILSKYNLNVTWRSGFDGINDLRNNISGFDAIILITKQMSHTILREISETARKNHTPVVYSNKRGISSIISGLKEIKSFKDKEKFKI